MKKLTRRSVLAGLASTPLLSGGVISATKGFTRPSSIGTRWLYVYIHGAFVLDIQAIGVRLLFPRVYLQGTTTIAHEYHAGYLPNGEGILVDDGTPLSLVGFKGSSTIPALDPTSFPYFKRLKLNFAPLYFSVTMPLPDAIVPLRLIPKDPSCGSFFGAAELQKLEWLPLLVMLQYEIQPGEKPALMDGSWSDNGGNPLILHFRGEPGASNTQQDTSLSAIGSILGTSIQLSDGYYEAVACAKNDEEQDLLELRHLATMPCTPVPADCSKGTMKGRRFILAGHPANCVGIGNCPTCT